MLTNRKAPCSIPNDVIGIFHCHNLSDCTVALDSTQPLTEMNTKCISWDKKRPVRKADNLTTILGHCYVIWEPLTSWNPLGLSSPVMGLIPPFTQRLLV